MRSQLTSKICEQENYESYGCFLTDIQMTSFSKGKYPFLSVPMITRVIQNFKHDKFISATAFLDSLRKRNAEKWKKI